MPLLQVMVRAGAMPWMRPTVPSLSVIVLPVTPTVTAYVQAPPDSAPEQGCEAESVTNSTCAPFPSTQVPPTSQVLLHCSGVESVEPIASACSV